MNTFLLVGADSESGDQISKALKRAGAAMKLCCADEATVEALFVAERPSVVVLGPLLDAEAALALVEKVSPPRWPCEFVLVTVDPSTALMRNAMRAGVRDVLAADAPFEEVAAAVRLASEAAARRPVSGSQEVSTGSSSAKVVTVFGTKGGVGKSVIATNLAVSLAQAGHSVVVLDLDLQFGDVAIMLQLPPERTLFDAVQVFDRLDPDMLQGFMVEHSSGLRALLAPVQPEHAEAVTAARVSTIIGLLRTMTDYVVIDTPASFNEVVLAALEHSDEVYAVATMDVPSVKNVKISLQKLRQLGLEGRGTHLVLNRADSRVGLQPSEIETATGHSIVAKVPSDRLVPLAVNRGVPVVLDSPRSPVARSLTALATLASARIEEVEADVA